MVRRKVAEVLDRSGLSPRSHSGKDLMADPGGLPARRAVPDHHRRPVPTGDGRAAAWPAGGSCGCSCAGPYGRFISCLVYLPRDRFTTANRLRIQEILLRGAATASASTTPPGSPSRRWPGSTSSCAPTRPTRPARSTPTRSPSSSPTRPGSGTTTSRCVLERKLGEEQASDAVRRGTRDALPGQLQGRAHAVRGGAGPGQAGAARGARPAGAAPVPPAARTTQRRAVQGVPVRRADDALGRAAGAALARACGSIDERPYEVQPRRRHRSTSTTSG